MKVLLDISPLSNAHSIRGIGVYTRFLQQELEKLQNENFFLLEPGGEIPDITHYPFFDLFSPTLSLNSAQKSKIIVTVHDVIPLLFPEQYPVGIKGKLFHFRQKRALQKVDAVITDSQASAKDIHNYLNIDSKKIHSIYLAGNPEIKSATNELKNSVQKRYGLPEKFILYVGDINYNKNIPGLIQALQFLPEEIHLVCVGKNFHPHLIPEWEVIREAVTSVKDRVQFITDLSKEGSDDLSAIYSSAQAYVQPSFAEGFGLPVLEAMQAKIPVICAKNSSLLEVGGEVVQFVGTSSGSIAEGIQKILALNATQRKKLIEQGQKWVKTFSWHKTAQQTLELYQSVHST